MVRMAGGLRILHPAMRKDEGTKPPQQNDVVDDQAPKQKLAEEGNIHLFFPMLAVELKKTVAPFMQKSR